MAKSIKNYKTLSSELDTVVAELQSSDVDIDRAIELYERGQKILIEIETYLKTAETKISKLNRIEIDT
jgi:exodeoxyribonuclease VII small subunit